MKNKHREEERAGDSEIPTEATKLGMRNSELQSEFEIDRDRRA